MVLPIREAWVSLCMAVALSAPGVVGTGHSSQQEVQVYLIATVDDGPAMQEVGWKIYRQDNGKLAGSGNTHMLVLALPPGEYRAMAQLHVIRRERAFTVSEGDPVEVVVAMDNVE